MATHTLTLLGGQGDQLRVPAELLVDAIGALLNGARMATRFAVEGVSVRPGKRPPWLEAACALQVTRLSHGSVVVAIEAPSVQHVLRGQFGMDAQQPLRHVADNDQDTRTTLEALGDQTAVDVFGGLMARILEGEPDDIRADRALLDVCATFAQLSGGGYGGVRIDGLAGRLTPLVIRAWDAVKVKRLRDATPGPRAVRVAGRLDTISASMPDVVLVLDDGTRVPGRVEQHDLEALRSLVGEDVVVSGVAHFNPSRKLQRIDVESLDVARPQDRAFRRVPRPRTQRLSVVSEATADDGAVSAFFGTWPGEETDAELLDAVRALG